MWYTLCDIPHNPLVKRQCNYQKEGIHYFYTSPQSKRKYCCSQCKVAQQNLIRKQQILEADKPLFPEYLMPDPYSREDFVLPV